MFTSVPSLAISAITDFKQILRFLKKTNSVCIEDFQQAAGIPLQKTARHRLDSTKTM